MGKKAVILLSGGLDSATTLALAAEAGYECYALSFDYGQRHLRELESAERLAEHYQVREHKIIPLELPGALQSALTNPEIELIEGRAPEEMRDIPTSYVPARNTIMLSFALGYAEVIGADCIFIGVNSLDYSGYPDCRPEYIEAFQGLANLATRQAVEGRPVRIEAPLLHLTKAEIIRKGMEIGVPYELTWSCYRGGRKAGGSEASDGRLSPKGSIRHEQPEAVSAVHPKGDKACGRCDSCILRLKGFKEAGYEDPIEYE